MFERRSMCEVVRRDDDVHSALSMVILNTWRRGRIDNDIAEPRGIISSQGTTTEDGDRI